MQFCDYCGREITPNIQQCPNCFKELATNNLMPRSWLIKDGIELKRVAILLGMIATFVFSTYAPWQRVLSNGQLRQLGYSFLWQAPAANASVDYGRVAISIAAILSFTTCVYLVVEWLQRRRDGTK